MRINIDINVGHFDGLADAYVAKVVRPAMATGLNNAAEHIKQDLSKATLTAFDRPKPFTQNAFTFFRAVPRKGKDINAVIRVKSIQAQYLDIQVRGGTVRAGDHATTKKGPLVPGKGARLNKFGGLPRGWTARQAAREDTYWDTVGKSEMPALLYAAPEGANRLHDLRDLVRTMGTRVAFVAVKLRKRNDLKLLVSANRHRPCARVRRRGRGANPKKVLASEDPRTARLAGSLTPQGKDPRLWFSRSRGKVRAPPPGGTQAGSPTTMHRTMPIVRGWVRELGKG